MTSQTLLAFVAVALAAAVVLATYVLADARAMRRQVLAQDRPVAR